MNRAQQFDAANATRLHHTFERGCFAHTRQQCGYYLGSGDPAAFYTYCGRPESEHPIDPDKDASEALRKALKELIDSHEHLCRVLVVRDETWAIGERARAALARAEGR